MGIRDKPIAAGSPWQNGFAERLIGSIRRECVDHVIVLGEAHSRRILTEYAAYYNELRNSSISWQRRSNPSCYPAPRSHRIGAGRGWPPPALLLNLVFGTDRSAAHPWRTAQARLRDRSVQRREVHGQAMRSALSDMACLPAEPCTGDRRHGPVRCSDHRLRSALCLRHRPAGPPRPCLDQRNNPSDRGMDRSQITEAFPWNEAPRYLIRDRDQVYGAAATRRLRTMGIRDKPIAPGSPWQNGFAERLIGSIRRECVDHIVGLGRRALAPHSDEVCRLL